MATAPPFVTQIRPLTEAATVPSSLVTPIVYFEVPLSPLKSCQ